jgi:hypothetical protein
MAAEASPARFGWLHALNALLLVGLWGYSLLMAGRLPDPDTLAVGAGPLTRWIGDGGGFWWIGPILGTIHAGFMYALAPVVRVSPHGIGVPHKRRLLALGPADQAYALQPLRAFLYALAAWLLALMWLLQLQMYVAAGGAEAAAAQAAALFVVVLAFTLLPAAGVVVLLRVVNRRIERCEARNPTEGTDE